MSETPHRNSQSWGWNVWENWKQSKTKKKRNRHNSSQPGESHHGGSHHGDSHHANAAEAQDSHRNRDFNQGWHRWSTGNRLFQQFTQRGQRSPHQASGGTPSAKTGLVSSSPPGAQAPTRRSNSLSSGQSTSVPTTSRSDSSGASAETATTSACKPEIPGFYYDPDKKKYFRLVAGHNNFNPLTNESLQRKDAEKKRKQMLEDNRPISRKHTTPLRQLPLGSLHRHLQTGQLTSRQFTRYCHEQALSHLDLRPRLLDSFPDDPLYIGKPGDISYLEVDPSYQKVLMVMSHDNHCRMWLGNITCDPTRPNVLTVSERKVVNDIGTRNSKVTSAGLVSWGDDLFLMYSYCGSYSNSVHLLQLNLEVVGYDRWSYDNGKDSVLTCAWSMNPLTPQYLSVGSDNKAMVADMKSRRHWNIFTNHSDVLAQVFATRSPVLYNGTRRGEILGCDLRTLSQTRPALNLSLQQKVAVCSIRLLQDENYLLASDLSGQIRLWDIRQCLCVQEFEGHFNQHSMLPICIDSTEGVLYGVGQDDYTRFWSLHDGHLLRMVPSPESPSAPHVHPSVVYSREWNKSATPGLLLGLHDDLYWYSL